MQHDDDMPTHRRWADLHADLVSRVADLCALQGYASCRAVCGSWRAALPPPTSRPLAPVVVPADGGGDMASHGPLSLAVCSVHSQRWSRLLGLRQPSGLANATGASRCVGARDGWVVLAAANAGVVLLFNPLSGVEIPLHASLYDPKCERASTSMSPPKVVFSPCPTARDFAAVSICRPNRLAVQRTTDGYSSALVLDTAALMDGADLADVAFDDNGMVAYCLTRHGAVHVLRLNRRRHRGRLRPIEIEQHGRRLPHAVRRHRPVHGRQEPGALRRRAVPGVEAAEWRGLRRRASRDLRPAAAPHPGERRLRPEVRAGAAGEGEPAAVLVGIEGSRRPRGVPRDERRGDGAGDGAAELMNGDCSYYWASRADGDYEAFVYSMADRISTRLPPATGGVSSPLWYFLPAGAANVEATTAIEAASEEVSIAVTV